MKRSARGLLVDGIMNAPLSVLSMMLKFEMLLRKSDARGAYGFRRCCSLGWEGWALPLTPLTPFALTPLPLEEEGPLGSTGTMSAGSLGRASPLV